MSTPCPEVAAIVLAAGSASRMGKLKQILAYQGKPLVSHAVHAALTAQLNPVLVVVGAEAPSVQAIVANQRVEIVQNPDWATGMGSSIRAGIKSLQKSKQESAGVAVLLADQPLVSGDHLIAMRRLLFKGHPPIVAAHYNGTLGVPAFFRREMFGFLATLDPAAGARPVLRNSASRVYPFPLPEAAMDIDTPEDFAALPT